MKLAVVTLVACSLVAGCGDDSTDSSSDTTTTSASTLSGDVTVFAAASLTEAFTEIGEAFEAEHEGVTVTFNFGASSALVTSLTEGAPADVFASADEANMTKLTDAELNAAEPEVFARNELEIIVQPGNPKGVSTLEDLADPSLAVVLCAVEVPCGKYAKEILDGAGVTVTPKSYEENVKGVVTRVTVGDADAGIVYATDVQAAGDEAEGVAIPADQNAIATYPLAVLKDAPNGTAAEAFAEFVGGADGQRILKEHGFLPAA